KDPREIYQKFDAFLKLRDLEPWNYYSTSFCNNRNLFIDHLHMNAFGARIFTLKFAKDFNNKELKKSF
ncbi:MAG: hypothetical protein AB7O73_13185, partial [Bacteroidia bacterium]